MTMLNLCSYCKKKMRCVFITCQEKEYFFAEEEKWEGRKEEEKNALSIGMCYSFLLSILAVLREKLVFKNK